MKLLNRKGICDFLLVINSNFGPILHRFWDTATYLLAEKNCEFFLPPSHLTPSLGVNHFEFLDEFFIPKTRVLGLSVGEDFVILACVVFTQYQRVTDGQTDIPTMASTGLAYDQDSWARTYAAENQRVGKTRRRSIYSAERQTRDASEPKWQYPAVSWELLELTLLVKSAGC